ncbi:MULTISPECIES: hypothetical protein [Francisella]|uniref:Uncharacterized protein n=1 Tax=Francisella opportunistica TaxID=2016517 RepID=A0A345JSW1_9GAMM|nr:MULTISPECIES: hypothetical protein [Francisella]APC92186.1 hypothetical protein BBG19_1458 [Francisella sp. MA067296]AXH30407.1 hypothetical protein CGC43_07340 [Francisella opportunistica]AXH32047.1 hypothetical protein CGC44_07315 [Francisella opportunistica]AXH33695.1 hypothetical protein CGC45_07345 [Francisella opportunistica]
MQYNYFSYPNEKLPPYGSVMYFAYRKLATDKQQIIYLLDQIKSQIISCTELYNNLEVANAKMNWWLKEVNNLNNKNNIASPQLKKLAEIFDQGTLYQKLTEDISLSIDNSSATQRDFKQHFSKNFLGIETLKALYLNDFAAIDSSKIEQINANNEIVRHIFCIPKHFYNQISFDNKITPTMSSKDFKDITTQWLELYKKTTLDKKLKPLKKINKIHHKMVIKYIKSIDNPFRAALDFSPLNLLFYSL